MRFPELPEGDAWGCCGLLSPSPSLQTCSSSCYVSGFLPYGLLASRPWATLPLVPASGLPLQGARLSSSPSQHAAHLLPSSPTAEAPGQSPTWLSCPTLSLHWSRPTVLPTAELWCCQLPLRNLHWLPTVSRRKANLAHVGCQVLHKATPRTSLATSLASASPLLCSS